jgi:hypothetical protein
MEKATGTMAVILVIGLLAGGVGGYYVMQNQSTTAFNQGMAYQQSLQTQAAVTAAPDITCTWDTDEFNFSGVVDANGDVATDTEVTANLTIENNAETDASNVWISLYNPVKNKYGLDADLELDDLKVTIAYGGVSKITLYKDGEYTSGYEIGTIPAGSEVSITVSIWFMEHDDGDFPYGDTLDNELYVYGAGATSVETCDFTVIT